MSDDGILTRLAELERGDRLEDAARLAEQSGMMERASELWERACHYDAAARAALAADDPPRALGLAARAGDAELEAAAIAALSTSPDAADVADQVAVLGHGAAAARLRLALGDAAGAARDFEGAGLSFDAARAYESAGDPKSAARCLELLLARDATHHAARLALGELLARHGKLDAAARTLQQVPAEAPERRRALSLLASTLVSLGLDAAARELAAELDQLGGPVELAAPSSAAAPAGVERVLFGRYRVLADVATTPTARVYRALDRITGEEVAVKVFAPGLRESGRDALVRFEREARALGQLRHPAIVPLRAYLPDGPAVVLRWMEGGSLADLLAESTLSPARAAEITLAVLGALGEAHRRGILHRDIKPANVLFDGAGAAHLADFGTAHVADSAVTVTAGVIGTLAYMAPEQRAGEPASVSSDVYGAGALFWHALTGGPPDAELGFLSDELGDPQRTIAERLIAPTAERPSDTVQARALIQSVSWPLSVPEERRAPAPERSAPEPSLRLIARAHGAYEDRLLGRELHVLPADADTLARVVPFAKADHPGLASVLVHQPEPPGVWVEAVIGTTLDAPLTPAERHWLEQALAALHRAGGAHGAVDRAHVVRRGGCLVLRFPSAAAGASAADDLAALERL